MNELKVFRNADFGEVRTVLRDGEPWFVAADVCKALEIADTWNAMTRLDPDEKGADSISTPGGQQDMTVVNEPGLYALVLGSRKPEARAFKRWITHEVIPTIRQHGMYATPATVEAMLNDPDTMIRTLTALKDERARRVALEVKAEADAPKVLFADSVAASKQSILVGELATLLRQNGIQIGQNRLFEDLRKDGYLVRQSGDRWNLPTQRSMEMGLFEIKEHTVNAPDGSVRLTRTTKVTGRGQIYFINRYKRND